MELAKSEQKEAQDVLPYEEGQDNASAYRNHEQLRDQHDSFLHKQANKDVAATLGAQRRRTMSKDIRTDIKIRGGVLPAPTNEREMALEEAARQRSGTLAEQRAAVERQTLEPAMKQKRKVSQLRKMQNNNAYQTPAGKRAIELALEEEGADEL
jgi:hypothetical protein